MLATRSSEFISSLVLATIIAGFYLRLSAPVVPDEGDWPSCLSGEPGDKPFIPEEHGCNSDPMGAARNDSVLRAEQMFGLNPSEITVIGCEAAPFSAKMTSSESPHFQILYRSKNGSDPSYYLAPFLHEVGHVYQLKRAGSQQRLQAELERSLERAELGADFLAGVAAKMLDLNPGVSQQTIFLVGSNSSGELGSHGTAGHRAAAFRMGYFYEPASDSVATKYKDFQDNRFAQAKDN